MNNLIVVRIVFLSINNVLFGHTPFYQYGDSIAAGKLLPLIHKGGTFSLWLSALGGILVIAVVYWTVPYSKGYQAADQRHQAEYDQNAADYEARRKCERLATVKSAVACYDHASKTSRESHRAEQDLDAQREMAQWAESVLYATLATFAAAIAGVVFLWRDTRQNMKIGQAQTRAYLSISECEFWMRNDLFGFDLTIFNSGQSPSLTFEVAWHARVHFVDSERESQKIASSFEAGSRNIQSGTSSVFRNFDGVITESLELAHEAHQVFLTMHIAWVDIFGKETIMYAQMNGPIDWGSDDIGRGETRVTYTRIEKQTRRYKTLEVYFEDLYDF